MSINIVRFTAAGDTTPRWGIADGDDVIPLASDVSTTGEFVTEVAPAVRAGAATTGSPMPADALTLLSPITTNQQYLCQAINYRSHMAESGIDPKSSPFNIFFRKASSCLSPPHGDIVVPDHVRFLDYEVEIGLVLGSRVTEATSVTPPDLAGHVVALVGLNDVSARDVQLAETQFYKAKSYRTFGPAGPYLALVDAADLAHFGELRLRLWVNGDLRQDSPATEMVHLPPASLTELSAVQDWAPGDILATGTPGGCALQAPPKPVAMASQLLSPRRKLAALQRMAARNPRALTAGDVVETHIGTADGSIDLGRQRNVVRMTAPR